MFMTMLTVRGVCMSAPPHPGAHLSPMSPEAEAGVRLSGARHRRSEPEPEPERLPTLGWSLQWPEQCWAETELEVSRSGVSDGQVSQTKNISSLCIEMDPNKGFWIILCILYVYNLWIQWLEDLLTNRRQIIIFSNIKCPQWQGLHENVLQWKSLRNQRWFLIEFNHI